MRITLVTLKHLLAELLTCPSPTLESKNIREILRMSQSGSIIGGTQQQCKRVGQPFSAFPNDPPPHAFAPPTPNNACFHLHLSLKFLLFIHALHNLLDSCMNEREFNS